MLLVDNFKEIAYRTNYFTTVSLLIVFPKLNTDEFWENKWQLMYPSYNNISFYTTQDVFLIRERKHFVLDIFLQAEIIKIDCKR